jgi:hypothetical protein
MTIVGQESSGAQDCPVSPQTGKFFSFLVEKASAPRTLRSIKGAPRRISWYPSILRALYNFKTPRPCYSSVWERFERVSKLSLFVFLHPLLCVCVYCCCVVLFCAYYYSPILHFLLWSSYVRHARLQLVEIPHKRDIVIWGRTMVLKFDIWITWKGLSTTLVHWYTTTWSRQLYYVWPNHWIKIDCLLCHLLYSIFISSKFQILTCDIALSLNYILIEQSSKRNFSLSPYSQTWFINYYIPSLCWFLSKFCRITYSPPLGALTIPNTKIMELNLIMRQVRRVYTIGHEIVWDWRVPKSILPRMCCNVVPVGPVNVIYGSGRALHDRHILSQKARLVILVIDDTAF